MKIKFLRKIGSLKVFHDGSSCFTKEQKWKENLPLFSKDFTQHSLWKNKDEKTLDFSYTKHYQKLIKKFKN